ncbi:SLC13 family permease [Bacillus sp. 1NLA3E]|uniref:SLC13 family permease n=1 Tax=Bacillus sp. 1NLA3E TaxID=666686 RepID=UPI000247F04B|nr:SLC13 family permease [Bacillus sp. 1NLA3E]AGK54009.1 transporter [Bacillus sp. 1NLA3E]
MKEYVIIQNNKRINLKFDFLKKDMVFTISLILAIASCFLHTPKLEYINPKVMVSLFNLMIAIKAFEELKLLDKFAITILNKCNNSRTVSAILISLCFVCSMFVTNDVALLTFVPLTLIISKKTNMKMMETIILQTVAANIGSSLTPMGNPQNLFIYSYYGIKPMAFFATILLIAVLGIGLMYFSIKRLPKSELKVELPTISIVNRKEALIWGIVLAVIIASILGLISYQIGLMITLITVVLLNRNLLLKIDYLLLITFLSFFIFIGNISNTNAVHAFASANLKDSTSVFFSSIFLSQLISNVPASILLSHFTTDWKPLLLGVNLGGLGTIVASLASVISYKLFIQANPQDSKMYLIKFSIYNFTFLVFLTLVHYVIFRI